ncbi:MAG: hypothetical protein ABIU09_12990 [Pyrinomonadaceae bacterium]
MFKSIVLVFICFFSANAFAQNVAAGFDLSNYGVRIEPDKRVMLVLATLEAARTTNAAGEDVPVINTALSPEGLKFRELLKSDLAALNGDLRQKISSFVVGYKNRNPKLTDAELVAPFISMAYALTPAPELADPVVTSDLPGNLLDVLDFAPLVRDFYRRSSVSGNINEYIKTYQKTADGRLRTSAREMVSDLLNYLNTKPQLYFADRIKTETARSKSKSSTLKNVEIRERERRLYIVPELLAPLGNVSFINIKDDYHVVLPAESDLSFSEVRRAFLQFVIDPLVNGNSKDIETIRPAVKKLLDDRRKIDPSTSPDVYLTISRSLVASVDAKQNENVRNRIATDQSRGKIDRMRTVEQKKAVSADLEKYKKTQADETILRLSEDYDKGAILVFYFADQLSGVEDSGFDIASSLREMLLSFDATKETGRYAQYADTRKRALAAREERKKNPAVNIIAENPVTTRLVEIQKLIDAKNYVQADSELNQLIKQNPGEARIYYSIGRLASLSAESFETEADAEKQNVKLLEAKSAYENIVKIYNKQQEDLSKGVAVKDRVDSALISLSYVALAKIYEFYNNKTYALRVYDAALKLGPVIGGAYDEALSSKQRLLKDQ